MPDTLTIEHGDSIIEGRFSYRSRGAIEVEIVTAIYPFRHSLTMYVPRTRSKNGLLGEEGIVSGQQLLHRLHRLCRFLEKNRMALIAGYREFESMIPKDGMTDWWLEKEKKSLDAEMSEGRIDSEHYRESVASLEQLNQRYHLTMLALENGFFEHLFPFTVEPKLRNQVLEWLRLECAP